MSAKSWNAGIIRPVAVAPTGPYQNSAAPGVWTLDQQAYWQKQGLWPTAGNIDPSLFIENLFSTYLYTGTGATQTITNGIDLSGKGGLTWIKGRSGATDHALYDTVRGATFDLVSNSTAAQTTQATGLTAFSSTGFSIGALAKLNTSAATYASWTFREQAKFFDIVTYTGNGVSPRTINHNLGSVPGFITVKPTSSTGSWWCFHRSLGAGKAIPLNATDAALTSNNFWGGVEPTSTQFTVEFNNNDAGVTYIAYLFAHDAGGFGLTGTDNVISCGTFTATGNDNINLGYEPQWVLAKRTDASGNWIMFDVMRGMPVQANTYTLFPNTSGAETNTAAQGLTPTATGFNNQWFGASTTIIYIAIRRGPMKVPTSGTEVFGLSARTGTGANATVTGGTGSDDAVLIKNRGSAVASLFSSRLTGTGYLVTSSAPAEVAAGTTILQANPWDVMDGVKVGTTSTITNASANTFINYLFRRAPSFFDVVCYTGTGSATTITHNLASVPELMIVKSRSLAQDGVVYTASGGNGFYLRLFSSSGDSGNTATAFWNNTTPTSSVFSVGTANNVNGSGSTYVAYLFATCTGVSKVGSYTGTGATQTINCGFASGARFVLIKKSTSTAPDRGWYVWDSARGISSGNDPYLLLNTTAAEVTSTDYVNTDATGFQIVTSNDGVNQSGVTYIFLAIA